MRRPTRGAKRKTVGRVHHKTTKRRTHSRSRRMSGINDITGRLEDAGAVILGGVAAREFNNIVTKQFPSFSPLMSGLVQMGIGILLPMVSKNRFVDNVGLGMIAVGGMVTVVNTGIISGLPGGGQTYRVNGLPGRRMGNIKMIAGPDTRIGDLGQSNLGVTAGMNNPVTKYVY